MRLLCSFSRPNVRVDVATDNVRFIGTRSAVRRAVLEFLARCDAVGVVINEVPPRSPPAVVDRLIVREADFLGEVVDYAAKTVHVRAKIIERLRALMALPSWTVRNAVGTVAILLWCSAPLAIDICLHYEAMSYLRAAGRRMFDAPLADWELPADLLPSQFDDIARWANAVLANAPTPIPRQLPEPALTIFTDASAWGWGAVAVTDAGTSSASYPWGASLAPELAARSTTAEPEAVWRALCRFVPRDAPSLVRVMTDHSPFVGAWARGYSPAARLNGVIARIKRRFPLLRLVVEHVEGRANIADGASRGREPGVPR